MKLDPNSTTKREIITYLKENLKIKIEVTPDLLVEVKLLLDDKEISSSCDLIVLP